jgi:hypothetical protein
VEQNTRRIREKRRFRAQQILLKSKKTDDEHTAQMRLMSLYKVGGKNVMLPADKMESRGTLKLLDLPYPL